MVFDLGMLAMIVLLYFTLWFGVAAWKSRNDLADTAWGPGFLVGALYCAFNRDWNSYWSSQLSPHNDAYRSQTPLLSYVILGMVGIWALRLSTYIFFRSQGKPEDFRYQKMRQEWGSSVFWRSYLQVFVLQACVLLLVGLPVWLSLLGAPENAESSRLIPLRLNYLAWIGVGVWIAGLTFEAVADAQMGAFRRDKTKRSVKSSSVMQSGLWKYSRHPNYFGESVLWFGIYLVCLANTAPVWTIIGPLTLTFLLVRVSGIPLLEKKYKGNAEFETYQKRTSSFIPWFTKKQGNGK